MKTNDTRLGKLARELGKAIMAPRLTLAGVLRGNRRWARQQPVGNFGSFRSRNYIVTQAAVSEIAERCGVGFSRLDDLLRER